MPGGVAGDEHTAPLEQGLETLLEPGRLDVEESSKDQERGLATGSTDVLTVTFGGSRGRRPVLSKGTSGGRFTRGP